MDSQKILGGKTKRNPYFWALLFPPSARPGGRPDRKDGEKEPKKAGFRPGIFFLLLFPGPQARPLGWTAGPGGLGPGKKTEKK
jgi:hypothetical protein